MHIIPHSYLQQQQEYYSAHSQDSVPQFRLPNVFENIGPRLDELVRVAG